jgi:hypothetical protein
MVPNWTNGPSLNFVRSALDAERELTRTMHAPLSEQIGSRGTLDCPILLNYVDFHILRETSDMILDLEHSDQNSFPLNIDLNLKSASARPDQPSLSIHGALSRDGLADIAGSHIAALESLIGGSTR